MKKYIPVLAVVLGVSLFLPGCNNAAEVEEVKEETTATQVVEDSKNKIDSSECHNVNSLYIIANKSNPLPEGYEPDDLVPVEGVPASRSDWKMRKPCFDAYVKLVRAAEKDGVRVSCGSAYRSAAYQKELWQSYANQDGPDKADTYSSRPGHSDHQTGLCVDVVQGDGVLDGVNFEREFANCEVGKWMRAHAHEYGFILRYPEGKDEITGYIFEPWHYRYVGEELAKEMYEISPDLTMEEYFNVSGGKTYTD